MPGFVHDHFLVATYEHMSSNATPTYFCLTFFFWRPFGITGAFRYVELPAPFGMFLTHVRYHALSHVFFYF